MKLMKGEIAETDLEVSKLIGLWENILIDS